MALPEFTALPRSSWDHLKEELSSPRNRQSRIPALGEAVVMVAGAALQWSVACLGVTGLAPET